MLMTNPIVICLSYTLYTISKEETFLQYDIVISDVFASELIETLLHA